MAIFLKSKHSCNYIEIEVILEAVECLISKFIKIGPILFLWTKILTGNELQHLKIFKNQKGKLTSTPLYLGAPKIAIVAIFKATNFNFHDKFHILKCKIS